MAKILFSAQSNIIWDLNNPLAIDAFYEGLLTELTRYGNDVLFIRTNDVIDKNLMTNETRFYRHHYLVDRAKKFNPDLILTPNHSIPKEILDNTSCPVAILNADSPIYYSDKEYIKNNIDRYFFFHHDDNMSYADNCCKLFGATKKQNLLFGQATALQAEKKEIKNNIVFMGTLGWTQNVKESFLKLRNNKEFNEFLEDFKDKTTNRQHLDADYLHVLTANNRIKTLDALSDLGLKAYRYSKGFAESIDFSIDLLKCFDFTPMYKLKDTQDEFNASLIAPTLYNAQVIDGYSWRVVDVMASNACLISPPSKQIEKYFPFVPIYQSPQEAREVCQKLLKDEVWRKEIVVQSQQIIDEKHRFKHCFKNLEAIGVRIINEEKTGNIDSSINIKYQKKSNSKKKLSLIISLFINSFFLMLSCIPITNIFFKRNRVLKKIEKIIKSINDYKRIKK